MADHHEALFMADLAKIFEDDHDLQNHALPTEPVSQQHSGTTQKPGEAASPPMDPFLLPGMHAW